MSDLETGLVLRLEASLAKFEKQLARARKVGNDYSKDIEARFDRSNKRLSQSAENSAQAIGREMDKLRSKYDPLFRASKQYEAALEELNRAQKLGAVTARQYDAALGEINAEYQRATGAANRLGETAIVAGRSMRGMGGGIQNAAYQIGDFAVQVGAGTSAARALGMQLPQLLGGFGMWGAVIGAVVAGLVPLVSALMATEEEAQSLDDALGELRSAMSDFTSAVDDASQPMDELIEKYGRMAVAMERTLDVIAGTARVKALRELSDAASVAAGALGDMTAVTDADGNFLRASDAFMALRTEMGLTSEQASALAGAMYRLDAAEGPYAIAEAARDLQEQLTAALGAYERMPEAAQAQYDALSDIIAQAGEFNAALVTANENTISLAGLINDAANAMADLAGYEPGASWLSTAIGQASKLAAALWDAASARAAVAARTAQKEKDFLAYQYQQYGEGRAAGEQSVRDADPLNGGTGNVLTMANPNYYGSSRGGGGGGRSGASSVQREIDRTREAYERLKSSLDGAYSKQEQFAEGQEVLTKALQDGQITQEEYNETLDQLKEKFNGFSEFTGQFKDAIIDAAMGGADAFANLAESIKKAALQYALFGDGPMADWFGGSFSGLLGGLFNKKMANGGAFEGGIQRFAVGGVITSPRFFGMSGGVGQMGEAGPEAIMPLTRIGGKLGVAAKVGAGGSGGTVVQVINNTGAPTRQERQTGPDGREVVRTIIGEELGKGSYSKQMRGRYGVKDRSVKR